MNLQLMDLAPDNMLSRLAEAQALVERARGRSKVGEERPDGNVFEIVRATLMEFRGEVEDESGQQVAAMGNETGPIAEAVRTVLGPLPDVLAWLYDVVSCLEEYTIAVDPMVAALEVMSEGIEALAANFSFRRIGEQFNLPSGPLEAMDSSLAAGRDALPRATRLAEVLPRPEDVDGIKEELTMLLGNRVNPSGKYADDTPR